MVDPRFLASDPLMERTGWVPKPSGKVEIVGGWEPDPDNLGVGLGDDGDVTDNAIENTPTASPQAGPGDPSWYEPEGAVGQFFNRLGSTASDDASRLQEWAQQPAIGRAMERANPATAPVRIARDIAEGGAPGFVRGQLETARAAGDVLGGVDEALVNSPAKVISGQPYEESGLSKVPVIGGVIGHPAEAAAFAAAPEGAAGRIAMSGVLGATQSASAEGENAQLGDVLLSGALNAGLGGLFELAAPLVGHAMGGIRDRIVSLLKEATPRAQEEAQNLIGQIGSVVEAHRTQGPDGRPFWSTETPGYSLDELGRIVRNDTGEVLPAMAGGSEDQVTLEELQRAERIGQEDVAPLASIDRAPETFQHRQFGVSQETGSAGRLPEEDEFNPALAGRFTVWQDANGKDWLVNGHNRYAKAEAQGKLDTPVSIFRLFEQMPDGTPGMSAAAARAVGALQNVADGTVEPYDVVTFLREIGPDEGMAMLKGLGVPTAGNTTPAKSARKGIALAGLSDPIWRRYLSGDVNEDIAVQIGAGLPGNEEAQGNVLRIIEEQRSSPAAAQALIDMARQTEGLSAAQVNMFGETQADRELLAKKAEVIAALRDDLGANKVFGGKTANSRVATRLAQAGNVLNVEANKRLAQEARQGLDQFESSWRYTGPTSTAINEAASRLAKGAKLTEVLPDVIDAFRAETGAADSLGAAAEPAGPRPGDREAGAEVPAGPADQPAGTAAGSEPGEPAAAVTTAPPAAAGESPALADLRAKAEAQRAAASGLTPEQDTRARQIARDERALDKARFEVERGTALPEEKAAVETSGASRAAEAGAPTPSDLPAAHLAVTPDSAPTPASVESRGTTPAGKAAATAPAPQTAGPQALPAAATAGSLPEGTPPGSLAQPSMNDAWDATPSYLQPGDVPQGMTPAAFVDAVIQGGVKREDATVSSSKAGAPYDREALIDALSDWIAQKGEIDLSEPKTAADLREGIRVAYMPNALAALDRAALAGKDIFADPRHGASNEIALHFASFRGALRAVDGISREDGNAGLAGLLDKKIQERSIQAGDQSRGGGDFEEEAAGEPGKPVEVAPRGTERPDISPGTGTALATGHELTHDDMELLASLGTRLNSDVLDRLENVAIDHGLGRSVPDLPALPDELGQKPVSFVPQKGRSHPVNFGSDVDKALFVAGRSKDPTGMTRAELDYMNWLADNGLLDGLSHEDLNGMRAQLWDELKQRAKLLKNGQAIELEPQEYPSLTFEDMAQKTAAAEPVSYHESEPGESTTAGSEPGSTTTEPAATTERRPAATAAGRGPAGPPKPPGSAPTSPAGPEGQGGPLRRPEQFVEPGFRIVKREGAALARRGEPPSETPPGSSTAEGTPSGKQPQPGRNRMYWRPTNYAGGAAASYGVYQADEGDDETHRIAKALLAFPAGMAASHVAFGGPLRPRAILTRAEEAYINGILSPATAVTKAANDLTMAVAAPAIRGTQALFQGRIRTMAPEAIAQAVGEVSSMGKAWGAFVDALDPNLINRNPEVLGPKAPFSSVYERASAGQFSATLSGRLLTGITEAARVMFENGADRANQIGGKTIRVTTRDGVETVEAVDSIPPKDFADWMLLTGKAHSWSGKAVQGMLNLIHDKVPLVGPVLAPFRTIPGNLVEQTINWMPGLGLINLIGADATGVEHTLVAQSLALFMTAGLALTFGSNVNGAGPTDAKQRGAWLQQRNQPWTVKNPVTNEWTSMRHFPAPIRGPLMAWGALMDAQKYGLNLEGAANEFGNSLESLDFFPLLFQTALDSMAGRGASAWKYFAAQEASGVVPWEIRSPARGERETAPDLSSRYVPGATGLEQVGNAAKRGLEAAIPGVERMVPPAISTTGMPKPNTNPGIGAVINPFRSVMPESDPIVQGFAAHGLQVQGPPKTIGKTPITPDEARRFTEIVGPQLIARGTQMLSDPSFQRLDAANQKNRLQTLETDLRRQAAMQVINESGRDFTLRMMQQPDFQQRPAKYTGVNDRGQELRIDNAIQVYQGWLRSGGKGAAPSPDQTRLAQAYMARGNPQYRIWAATQQQQRRTVPA